MRIFPVLMPSGARYWTVMDSDFEVVPVADRFLLDERFARGRAELTTKAYAGAIVLFLRWCSRSGRDWRTAPVDFALFIVWLKYTPCPTALRMLMSRADLRR